MRRAFALGLCLLLVCSCASLRKRSERAEARGEYARAAEGYQKLYLKASGRKQKNLRDYYAYRAAECNLRLRNISKALRQYQAAEHYGAWKPPLNHRIAYCLHALGRYEEAIQHYNWHLGEIPTDSLALVGLASCTRFATDSTSSRYELSPLSQLHNTGGDLSPQLVPQDNALYLVSRRRQGKKPKRLPTHGGYRSQAYRVERLPDGTWSTKVQALTELIPNGSELNALTLSADGQHLYYIHKLGSKSRIYRSHRLTTGGFSRGEALPIDDDNLTEYQGISLNASGTKLYLSARTKGQAHYDLYIQHLSGEKAIGKPQILPRTINSQGDELSPYAQGDSTLYFATDGRLSYGGYDHYRADLLPNDTWRLNHLPRPLNSPADEFALAPDYRLSEDLNEPKDAARGIIISNRSDTRGRGQLFAYRLPAERAMIDGYVLDREGYGISGATLRLVARYGHLGERIATSRQDGSFDFGIEPSNEYIMLASAPGYLSQYAELQTTSEDSNATYQVDFCLAQRGIPEVLRSLYFAFDSSEILPESQPALAELVKLLQDNPHIRLQLSTHTDRHGSEAYNTALSLRRASAVIKALQAKGIAPNRLSAQGFAWTKPYTVSRRTAEQYPFLVEGQVLNPAFIEALPTAEERSICDALNRRSEFLVLD